MPNISCPIEIKCICADGNPLSNLSSETPDVPTFTGVDFITLTPPLGTSWETFGCRSVCHSKVSQEAADLCAANQAFQCAVGDWRNPVNGNPDGPISPPVPPPQSPQGGNPYAIFQNEAQVGLALCDDGFPFNFTQPANTFSGFSQLDANTKALTYANSQAELRKICLSDITTPICIDVAINQHITASGSFLAQFPQTDLWVLESGSLPPGLTFNGGAITGGVASITDTPTTFGSYTFTISVTQPTGEFGLHTYTMVIAGITNLGSLPDGTVGDDYSFQLLTDGFTNPMFSLAVGSNPLPDGLALSSTGLIVGIPETEQTITSTFQVTENGGAFSCHADGTIMVTAAGLNFNDLVWDAPLISNDANSSATGNHGSASATDATNFGASSSQQHGQFIYTGAQTNCNLHVVIVLGATTNGGASASVDVFQDSNLIASAAQTSPPDSGGTLDVPFIVIAGVNSLIEVIFGGGASANDASSPISESMSFSITPAF